MVTGHDVVQTAIGLVTIPGAHYGSFDCPNRCHPEEPPHCEDCSGMTSAMARILGLGWPDCTGSFEQARIFHRAGTGLRYSEAVNTPGAFFFQGINEGQGGIPGVDHGHVGIFIGDGTHTVEARGHASGIGIFLASSLRADWCGMPPGINTTPAPGPTPDPIPVPALAPGTQEDNLMTTIAMPTTSFTPTGRTATARALREFNVVYLENGARVPDDVLIGGDPNNKERHYWVPPKEVQIPGWQIFDVIDLRPNGEQAIAAIYTDPAGGLNTYKVPVVIPKTP